MGQGAQKHISNHVIRGHPTCLNHHISNGPRCEMGETQNYVSLARMYQGAPLCPRDTKQFSRSKLNLPCLLPLLLDVRGVNIILLLSSTSKYFKTNIQLSDCECHDTISHQLAQHKLGISQKQHESEVLQNLQSFG